MVSREHILIVCQSFWEDYHSDVEGLGCLLSNDSFMVGDEGYSIWAKLTHGYSVENARRIREMLPREYEFEEEKYSVTLFPPISIL